MMVVVVERRRERYKDRKSRKQIVLEREIDLFNIYIARARAQNPEYIMSCPVCVCVCVCL